MTPHRCEQFVQRSALLLDLLEGSLSSQVSETAKDEIRRVLHYVEPEPVPVAVQLAEPDE